MEAHRYSYRISTGRSRLQIEIEGRDLPTRSVLCIQHKRV